MRAMERLAAHIFAPTGLSPAYSYITMCVDDQHSTTIMSISRTLGYDRSSISRMVGKLVSKGYLTVSKSGHETLITITESGHDLAKQADKYRTDLSEVVGTILSTEGKLELANALHEADKNVRRYLDDSQI